MSPPKPLVPPTAKRHPTLFTYPARYHKLLIFAVIALLALTVAPTNAADVPPQYRQYRYARSLAPEHVKREPAARPGHIFRVVVSIYAAVTTNEPLTVNLLSLLVAFA